MIQTYHLKPVGTGAIDYEAFIDETSTGGSMWAVTKDFGLIKTESREKCWRIRFDNLKRLEVIKFDDSRIDSSKGNFSIRDKNISEAIVKLKRHHQTRVEGEKNPYIKGNVFFVLEHASKTSTRDAELNLKRNKVFNKFNEMTLSQKADCAYYYGQNANLRHSELLNLMVDFKNGWLMRNSDFIPGYTFIEHFLDRYEPDAVGEQKIRMVINKAIITGVIKKRQDGFYLDDEKVAIKNEGEQALFEKLHSDDRLFAVISKKTNFDLQVDDDLGSSKPKEKTINESVVADYKIQELRGYAKGNAISGHWNKLPTTMIKELLAKGLKDEMIKGFYYKRSSFRRDINIFFGAAYLKSFSINL